MFLPLDTPQYAPGLNLISPELDNAIALVESQIEAYIGKSLELQTFTEIYDLGFNFPSFYPKHTPISQVTSLSVRVGDRKDYYGRPSGTSDWQELSIDDYTIDSDNRFVLDKIHSSFSGWGRPFPFNQAKLTYDAGFDFSDNSNKDVKAIKTAIGAILTYQQNNNYLRFGATSENIVGEYAVTWQAQKFGIPTHLLTIFNKYKINS